MALLKAGDRRALPGPKPGWSHTSSWGPTGPYKSTYKYVQLLYSELCPEDAWFLLTSEDGTVIPELPLIYIVEIVEAQEDRLSKAVNYIVKLVNE